ncbi:MAG: amidohydrolase [Planctomycetota bacterium]|nr:amidohydrolase [Planctomycetota bacterium]
MAGRLILLLLLCRLTVAEETVVYHNATVHTGKGRADTIVVRGARIVAVGKLAVLGRIAGRMVDLQGACVVPGFIDAHGHLAGLGALKRQLDLRTTKTYAEMLERVKEYSGEMPPGAWILGGRWDQANWGEKKFPHHGPLSAVTPAHPVLLSRVDGHAAIANKMALRLAGITRDTKNPPGGEILRDAAGEPTGILVDGAIGLVRRHVPEGGGLPTGELWKIAQEACFRVGLTGVHDAGIARSAVADLRGRYERGELKLRVYGMLSDGRGMDAYLAANEPFVHPRFTVRALKLYIDGAMGLRGAWLLEPYSDRTTHVGLNVMPAARLRRLAITAAAHGWQICTHAIGDRANREVLDAYEAALKGRPLRFRVEHAQCLSLEDIPRFKKLGVIASMQPTHATSDMRWAVDRVGPERLKGCYAWRRLLDTNARLAFGSDFPVESENPLWGFYAAVTRQDHDGQPEGGWLPHQRLTRAEALKAFTLDAAYAAFQEHELGTLEKGKLADFVVLDQDIMKVAPREILRTRVLRTVIAGETVFARSSKPPR